MPSPEAPTHLDTATDDNHQRPVVHPILRWPLRIYYIGAVFVLLALLGNIAVVPLAEGANDWTRAAVNQIADLVNIAHSYPIQTLSIGAVLLVLFVLGFAADREARREERFAAEYHARQIAREATEALVDRLLAAAKTIAGPGDEPGARNLQRLLVQWLGGVVPRPERATRTPMELQELASHIAAAAPAVARGVISTSGLPRPATLVGRDEELGSLVAQLRLGGRIGVFAIQGLGGVGKTALAAEAVAQLSQDQKAFPGGTIWISCEGLTGAGGLAELWSRVARAIGAEYVAAIQTPEERRGALHASLSDPARPRLLIALDDIGPGLDVAALVSTLAGGRATLLLTSRTDLAGEGVQRVALSPLPDQAGAMLFEQRLHAADPERPEAQDRAAIPALVGLLGGVPLALELAAAYAGTRGVSLDDLIREVQEAGMDATPIGALRMRADRSWSALTASQQRLFAGLALIEGASFPRSAAIAVGEAVESHEQVVADLAVIVTMALVEPLADERLRLHPLLREYAASRLSSLPLQELNRLGAAMVGYWLEFAQAHTNYEGWWALQADDEALMGALSWAYAHGSYRDVLGLVHAMISFWYIQGRVDEAGRALRLALTSARMTNDVSEQRFMEHELAQLLEKTGHPVEARAGFERAIAVARELRDRAAEREELHALATLDAEEGRLVEARAGYESALYLARELGDIASIQRGMHALATLDAQTGRLAEARARYEEALRLARELGDRLAEGVELHALAMLDAQRGDLAAARAGYAEALALARELGDVRDEQAELHSVAALEAQMGRLAEARAGYEQALTIARQIGDPSAQAVELYSLGALDVRTYERERARGELEEALALARQVVHPALVAEVAFWLAELNRQEGHTEAACEGFKEALAIYERLGNPDAAITRDRLLELGCEP